MKKIVLLALSMGLFFGGSSDGFCEGSKYSKLEDANVKMQKRKIENAKRLALKEAQKMPKKGGGIAAAMGAKKAREASRRGGAAPRAPSFGY